MVNTPIGPRELDSGGSAIGAVRMDPEQVVSGIAVLLKDFIDTGSQKSWDEIRLKIDGLCAGLTSALDALDAEAAFSRDVTARVERGQKLLFKPNIVSPSCIDRITHGPGPGSVAACTPWYFVAGLMRWFHDRLDVSYHQMSLGEGGTTMSATAAAYMLAQRGKGVVTTEAVLEGKWGSSYGGWGFYFVRKYLVDTHARDHKDDPMSGYEESIAGACLPPGDAGGKLLIYDINKIADDGYNGRDVSVAHGVNFQTITLHKAVIGGDPGDARDIRSWPGCVLVNVPRLKIHNLEILTGAVKNLGVGLYPMEAQDKAFRGETHWKYAHPHKANPALKSGIPHTVWVADIDNDTGMPRRDKDGKLVARKTGGLSGTMADVIEAVKGQDIMMLHVVDAIEPTDRYHAGAAMVPVLEGYVFASIDPVAVDLLCARYMFTTMPMAQAKALQKDSNAPVGFFQKVPVPEVSGRAIVTTEGYDSPVARYGGFAYCQQRGLGQLDYYVVGKDGWQGGDLGSVEGHLGRVNGGVFTELMTSEMYYAATKPLLDLQATTLAYARANDTLTGSNYTDYAWSYDENGDGVIDYDEKTRSRNTLFMAHGSRLQSVTFASAERLRTRFLLTTVLLRCTKKEWNPEGFEFNDWTQFNATVATAMAMSQSPVEGADPFFQGMVWGKGKWPSIQYAECRHICTQIFGGAFPRAFDVMMAPYGAAFQYADAKFNQAARTSPARADTIARYHAEVEQGVKPLPFTLYVPSGYGKMGGRNIPNVEETTDPNLIFTAGFDGGCEVWRELSLLSIP